MIECLNCGSETNNQKFCCRSCAATYNNKQFPKKKLDRKCSKCNEKVKSYRHTLCEFHHVEHKENKYKSLSVGEYRNLQSVKGKHPSWINSHVRNFARSWLSPLTKEPCRHCGYDKHVELAHIQAVSSFPDNTPLNVINSESNVLPLCPNCHWEFDNLPRD